MFWNSTRIRDTELGVDASDNIRRRFDFHCRPTSVFSALEVVTRMTELYKSTFDFDYATGPKTVI